MGSDSDESSSKIAALPCYTRLKIKVLTFAQNVVRRSDGTVNRTLLKLFDPKVCAFRIPIGGVTSTDHTIDPTRNLWFRLYTPTAATGDNALPVIVYFHGGGFIFYGPNTQPFDGVCRRLARGISAIVVSVNYRLAPEYRYPAAFDDGLDALKFIDEAETGRLLPANADLGRCFIVGDSAGGNMVHNVTLRACTHDFKKVKIKAQIPLMPYFGGEERTESELRLTNVPFVNTEVTDWTWKAFLPEGSNRDHEAVNVFGGPNSGEVVEMLRELKFPATLLVMGGLDPLQDWQRRYIEGLKRCGKETHVLEFPNSFHGFYAFPELPEASRVVADIRDFIRRRSELSTSA